MFKKHRPLWVLFTTIFAIFWMLLLILLFIFRSENQERIEEPIPEEYIVPTSVVVPIQKTAVVRKISYEPAIAQNIESEEIEPRYGFTDDDIYLMTVLLCGSKNADGDGEYDIDFGNQDRHDQISLVLCVVMNRVRSDIYPNTVSEVIWQRGQFSPMSRWKKKLPEVSKNSMDIVRQWCEDYDNYISTAQTIPEDHLYFSGNGTINRSR